MPVCPALYAYDHSYLTCCACGCAGKCANGLRMGTGRPMAGSRWKSTGVSCWVQQTYLHASKPAVLLQQSRSCSDGRPLFGLPHTVLMHDCFLGSFLAATSHNRALCGCLCLTHSGQRRPDGWAEGAQEKRRSGHAGRSFHSHRLNRRSDIRRPRLPGQLHDRRHPWCAQQYHQPCA
jgi:hypothetical protein